MMYGGLKKSASRLALVAAAGVLSTNAFAADLGGDCCADLEERVAELEATTARKGTRKTSLEVYGQVNKAIVYWNDGARSNAALGVDNHNQSSRVGFRGNAKVSPNVVAGYSMLFEWGDKARTSTTSQTTDTGSSRGRPDYGSNERIDDAFVRLRDANVWIESKTLGRVTMGRLLSENILGSIDIAGIQHAAGDDFGCNGGGLAFRNAATGLLSTRVVGGPGTGLGGAGCGGPWANRVNGLKYNSPTLAGFTLTASIGDSIKVDNVNVDTRTTNLATAGSDYGLALKYAGEFSGVRVAAAAGYNVSDQDHGLYGGPGSTPDQLLAVGAANGPAGNNASGKSRVLDLSLALMHIPTGLFAQGVWDRMTYDVQDPASLTGAFRGNRDATRWHIAAGIQQNWFGIGKTTVYGEYERMSNYLYATSGYSAGATACPAGPAACTYAITGSALSTNAQGDSFRSWGIGLNQAVDAAAMDLYVNGRVLQGTDAGTTTTAPLSLKDITVITTGARIKF